MLNRHRITIYIMTYNRSQYLKECIESVLAQTYTDFKLVILDNASTDNTEETVRNFKDNRISYIKHSINIGFPSNANYAIETCDTEYFVIFHDDDTMLPEYIEKIMFVFQEDEDLAILSTRTKVLDTNASIPFSREIENQGEINVSHYCGSKYFFSNLRGEESIACPTVAFRASFMREKNLFFNIDAGPACDAYLWYEIERNSGRIGILEDVLVNYRMHEGQMSGKDWTNDYVLLFKALDRSNYYRCLLETHKLLLARSQLYPILKTCSLFSSKVISKDRFSVYIGEFENNLIKSKAMKKLAHIVFSFTYKNPQLFMKIYQMVKRAHCFAQHKSCLNTIRLFTHTSL